MNDELQVKEASVLRRCAFKLGLHLCSHVGLVSLVVVYTLLGAVIFTFIEGDHHVVERGLIQHSREECLKELWTITERLNVLYERNWTKLVHEQLRKFEKNVVEAARTQDHDSTLELLDSNQQWSFSSALLYSVTVITTIGYGNLSPKTPEGKIVTMIYATFGVPLMLLCLSSLGQLLAKAVQFTYIRLCCRSRDHYSNSSSTSNNNRRTERKDPPSYQKSQGSGDRQYTHKYQRTPTSPAHQACIVSHDTSVIQLSATHNIGYQTPKKTAVLATVNSSHTRGRCRLASRPVPASSAVMNIPTPATSADGPSRNVHPECSTERSPEPPDIEDADETDDPDNGNFSHDTPSRIPLIWRQESKRTPSSPLLGQTQMVSVPAMIVFVVLVIYLCIGAVVFSAWENWSFLDATYFCFTTLSTIGFGDMIPGKKFPSADSYGHFQIVACCAYLLLGLVLVAMSFSLVHDEVIAKSRQLAKAIGIVRH